MRFRLVLPVPRFVLHPLTAVFIAAVHVYPLAFGHLWELLGGDIQWTHIWKGFGALGGAYVFAALASRGLVRREEMVHLETGHAMDGAETQTFPDGGINPVQGNEADDLGMQDPASFNLDAVKRMVEAAIQEQTWAVGW